MNIIMLAVPHIVLQKNIIYQDQLLETGLNYTKKNKTISKEETRGKSKFARPITLEDYKERYEILKKYQAFLKAQRERK